MGQQSQLHHRVAQGDGLLLGGRHPRAVQQPRDRLPPHEARRVPLQVPVPIPHLHALLHAQSQGGKILDA